MAKEITEYQAIVPTEEEETYDVEYVEAKEETTGATYMDFNHYCSIMTGLLQFKKKIPVTVRYHEETDGFTIDDGSGFIPAYTWDYELSPEKNIIRLYTEILRITAQLKLSSTLLEDEIYHKSYGVMSDNEKKKNESYVQSLISVVEKI